jgi:hypothetical protein
VIGDADERHRERLRTRKVAGQMRTIDFPGDFVPGSDAARRGHDDDRARQRIRQRLKAERDLVVDVGEDRMRLFLLADRFVLGDHARRFALRDLRLLSLALALAIRLDARRDVTTNLVEPALELGAIETARFAQLVVESLRLRVPGADAILGRLQALLALHAGPRIRAEVVLRLRPCAIGGPATRDHGVLNLHVPAGAIHRQHFAAAIEDRAAHERQEHLAAQIRLGLPRMLVALEDREAHQLRAEEERRADHDGKDQQKATMKETKGGHEGPDVQLRQVDRLGVGTIERNPSGGLLRS